MNVKIRLPWPVCMFLAIAYCAVADDGSALWQALTDAPPSIPQSESRLAALKALDDWIAIPDSEKSPELIAYYRRSVDHVIDLLSKERPKQGIRYFQLYSSSEIIQTPSVVFAIDLDQGPNKDLHKTPEEEGETFCMTDEQVDKLTSLIDVSFHTHEHSDHIDYELTRALIEKGKTVVVTESNKKMWGDQPWAEKLVTLKQTLGTPLDVGKLKVDVLWDHQWNNAEHSSGTPCNAYVITTPEGMTVATKGDINCALQWYGWLNVLVEGGKSIDLMVGSPIYWRGVNLTKQIDALLAPVWAPGHNWEFEHRSAGEDYGNASPFTRSNAYLALSAKKGSTVVLSWGEHFDMPKPRKKNSEQ
ncbi:MAG: hypothetical protein K1Y02_05750 [Candidatus Hydrogenedentes bacterium]|nr:hypothetical protein [Candidatus Hydrogenedentota bacterium]